MVCLFQIASKNRTKSLLPRPIFQRQKVVSCFLFYFACCLLFCTNRYFFYVKQNKKHLFVQNNKKIEFVYPGIKGVHQMQQLLRSNLQIGTIHKKELLFGAFVLVFVFNNKKLYIRIQRYQFVNWQIFICQNLKREYKQQEYCAKNHGINFQQKGLLNIQQSIASTEGFQVMLTDFEFLKRQINSKVFECTNQ
eukprot:TRINITY_DN158_c1_g1_i7.p2 TRINITY_DN158_c1_g1~~TRINITY_DN158_c1_g1_i7.p2  ORF type:complete len:193 (-),score=0.55 TRINITY_DN158_c1_g1_i7:236-814(-)